VRWGCYGGMGRERVGRVCVCGKGEVDGEGWVWVCVCVWAHVTLTSSDACYTH
jgi:hypothetical protein